MRHGLIAWAVLQHLESGQAVTRPPAKRWSAERAREWGHTRPMHLGANYLPSHCSNVLDMFAPAGFDMTLFIVERELRVARAVGFSSLRIFLHEDLYFHRGIAFLDDVARLLEVLARQTILAIFVLFDACWRPDLDNVDFIPGVHNSAWVQCPTHNLLGAFSSGSDRARERLYRYVTEVVGRFADDPRVVAWDVYNEATMRESEHWILPRLAAEQGWKRHPDHWLLDGKKLQAAMALLRAAVDWVRSVGPSQPITIAVWDFPTLEDDAAVAKFKADLNNELLEMSDVVSLHCYCEPEELEEKLSELAALQRGPILVTEFLARPRGSTVRGSLPVFRRHGAWGYTWGLFNGRSQTHRPWDTWVSSDIALDTEWFHDVFYANGTAYSSDEVKDIWWHTVGQELKL